jgi:outer membrane protease
MSREQLAMSKEKKKFHENMLSCKEFHTKPLRHEVLKFFAPFRLFVIVFFFIFCTTAFLFSETDNNSTKNQDSYQFSTGISAGMLHGTAFELVYHTKNILLSELRWDMKPLFYIGTFLEYSQKNPLEDFGFYGNIHLKGGFPAQTGSMEDRDWLASGNQLSRFSTHENYTDSAFLIDASLGISVPLFSSFIVKPLLNFHYMDYKWNSKNGYTQYAENDTIWDDSVPKKPIFGSVVGYSQKWFIFSLGFSLQYHFFKRFMLEGNFLFSPLIFIHAIDDHYLGNIRYYDNSKGGYMLEPALSFIFSINNNMNLNFKASYRHINNSKGSSYAYNTENNSFFGESRVGAGYKAWDIIINFRYSFEPL